MGAVGEPEAGDGFIARGTSHGAQQLGSRGGRGYAELSHPVRLGARAPAGCRAQPDLIVAVAAQEPRSAELAQQPLPRCARWSDQRREMLRVGTATERRGRETPRPERDVREPVPRNVDRSPEREQLTPQAEQECHRGQRLDQLRRNVSHVAKARAADARFLGVCEQHAPARAGQSAGDRAADDAGADHRDPVLLPHGASVYDRCSHLYHRPQGSTRLITPLKCSWSGVFPAATTQFRSDLAVDLPATCAVLSALVRDGVHGLVLLGTVGENNSLTAEEKRAVLKAAVGAVGGKVPLIAGVSELTTTGAVAYARDAERIGVNGLMGLPAMVYVTKLAELEYHLLTVAQATSLPVMLYNNPPAYRVNIGIESLVHLAEQANVVALKESSPDPRRFTDVFNALGDRYLLFAGLDDFVFEGLTLGARGWVSGLTNAFPMESLALYEAIRTGQLERARSIYRWFMPLLHLDSEPDLVQSIKLAEAVMGRGSERVRSPRLPLAGQRRAEVMERVERARAARPA